jgi:DNA-binding Lrp family transcriptional regulator
MKLDDFDKRIISMYAEDPKISQEDIAKVLKITQPSVAARIKKLRENGALVLQAGLDPIAMNLNIGRVDLTCKNTKAILDMFRNCPYFLNGFNVSGRFNLCLFFMSENISTMESIINGHIRPDENVIDVEFNLVINTARPLIVPTVFSQGNAKKPPCGVKIKCIHCDSHKSNDCMGCPATGQYQGTVF